MLDARNLVVLQGGVVRDLTIDDSKPIRFSIGVDFAGNNRVDSEKKSGYFDIIVFSNKTESYEFAKKLKKGDRVSVVGALRWSFWEQDGNKRSAVEVVGEHLRWASTGGGNKPAANGESSGEASSEGQPAGEAEVKQEVSGGFVI